MRIVIDLGATVYRRAGCSTFYLDLSQAGERKRISLKTQSKEVALERARALVKEASARLWSTDPKGEMLLSEFIKRRVERLGERNCAPRTIGLSASIYRVFHDWVCDQLKFARSPRLKDITPDMIQHFLSYRSKLKVYKSQRQLSPVTINRDRTRLMALFNWAVKKRFILANPVALTDPLTTIKKLPMVPSEEQIVAFLKAALEPVPLVGPGGKGNGETHPRNGIIHDVALLIVNTGLRLGEALHLEWSDINTDAGFLFVRSKPDYRIKDRQERSIRMNEVSNSMLQKRKESGKKDQVFVFSTRTGRRINRNNFTRDFAGVARQAGISWLRPQSLRRAFASLCASDGMPSFVLRELMGHSSIQTTERHYVGSGLSGDWIPPSVT